MTPLGLPALPTATDIIKLFINDVNAYVFAHTEDGSAILRTALHELGNGTVTAMAQIVAEVTGIEVSQINPDGGRHAVFFL